MCDAALGHRQSGEAGTPPAAKRVVQDNDEATTLVYSTAQLTAASEAGSCCRPGTMWHRLAEGRKWRSGPERTSEGAFGKNACSLAKLDLKVSNKDCLSCCGKKRLTRMGFEPMLRRTAKVEDVCNIP